MFRRIVLSACLAGLVAGIALTGVQQLQVVPIIIANAVFWAVLGAGCAIAFKKLA